MKHFGTEKIALSLLQNLNKGQISKEKPLGVNNNLSQLHNFEFNKTADGKPFTRFFAVH
jgi:hypothetical protein